MKVVLFDIDGTILWTDGAGRRAVHQALEDVFGHAVPEGLEFDGKTDPQIVRELLELGGLPMHELAERLPHVLERYVELLRAELGTDDGDQLIALSLYSTMPPCPTATNRVPKRMARKFGSPGRVVALQLVPFALVTIVPESPTTTY